MMASTLSLAGLPSAHLPGPVPYAVLAPESHAPLPLCLFLFGAGGTRDSLADLQPFFEERWADGRLARMAVAVPGPGLDYYLEDPGGAIRWDSFLAEDFLPHLRRTLHVAQSTAVAGISGGGYGALKLAFAYPHLFDAVAAMQPMLEPGFRESDVGPRNRLHHSAGGPPQLVAPSRDAALWESNNPANRARAHAHEIGGSRMAIYLEAVARDFLNAHDGAEFLHRVLWDLDIVHDYHLLRDADHGGPTMRPRIERMLSWISAIWNPPPVDSAAEEAASAWLQGGMQAKPPAGVTATQVFIAFLRARFEPLRAQAANTDETARRALGKLPG